MFLGATLFTPNSTVETSPLLEVVPFSSPSVPHCFIPILLFCDHGVVHFGHDSRTPVTGVGYQDLGGRVHAHLDDPLPYFGLPAKPLSIPLSGA